MKEIQSIKGKLNQYKEGAKERMPLLLRLAFLISESKPDESLSILPEVERIAQKSGHPNDLAEVYFAYGRIYLRKSMYAESENMFQQAIQLCNKSNNKELEGKILLRLSSVYYETVQFDKGLNVINRSIELGQKFGDTDELGTRYGNKALILSQKEDYEASIQNFDIALGYLEASKDLRGLSYANMNKGCTQYLTMGHAEAMKSFFKALEYSIPLENKFLEALIHNNIGNTYRVIGCFDEAIMHLSECLNIRRSIGEGVGIPTVLLNLTLVYLELKNIPKVFETLEEARKYLKKIDSPEDKFELLFNQGLAFKEIKEYEKAIFSFKESFDYAQKYNLNRKSTDAHIQIGLNYFLLEEYDLSLNNLEEGIKNYRNNQAKEYLADAYSVLADLAYKKNNLKKAYEYKGLELEERNKINSRETRNRIASAQVAYNIIERDNRILHLENEKSALQQNNEKTLQKYQNELSETIISSQESLKTFLSTELHTNVGLELVILKNLLEDDSSHKLNYNLLVGKVKNIHARIRDISRKVMDEQSNEANIIDSLQKLIKGLNTKNKLLKINLYPFDMVYPITPLKAFFITSFIRECISNCLQHANASTLDIHVARHEEFINIIVEDNGDGFELEQMTEKLSTYKNLAKQLKARLDIDPVPSKGTTIILDIPL